MVVTVSGDFLMVLILADLDYPETKATIRVCCCCYCCMIIVQRMECHCIV